MDNDLSYKSEGIPEHGKLYVRLAILKPDIWDTYIQFLAEQTRLVLFAERLTLTQYMSG
jgi:hypothetical protein